MSPEQAKVPIARDRHDTLSQRASARGFAHEIIGRPNKVARAIDRGRWRICYWVAHRLTFINRMK
jgi:hypothetical protein